MKYFLFIFFLFQFIAIETSNATSPDCVNPLGERSFTTWVNDSLDCISKKQKTEKTKKLELLSQTLSKYLENESNKEDLLNGVSALIWIIHHQVQNGDTSSAFMNEDKVFGTMERANVDSYSNAKILLPLADIWVESQTTGHSRPLLNNLIKSIVDIPQSTKDHENAQKMVLVSILDLLKRGGMNDLQESVKSRYNHLLE